jgi:urease accessory protein
MITEHPNWASDQTSDQVSNLTSAQTSTQTSAQTSAQTSDQVNDRVNDPASNQTSDPTSDQTSDQVSNLTSDRPARSLLCLLQLASPALPVGAYSYSEGLENAIAQTWITDAATLHHWLDRELTYGAIRLDAWVMAQIYHAARSPDPTTLIPWDRWLSATRETEELRQQGWQMGRSLWRLWGQLDPETMHHLPPTLHTALEQRCNFATSFAIAAAHWQIALADALVGYLHSWASNLINAGVKAIPLGQTTGQQLAIATYPAVLDLAQCLSRAAAIADPADLDAGFMEPKPGGGQDGGDRVGNQDPAFDHPFDHHPNAQAPPDAQAPPWCCTWGTALASLAHETQYTRLFRS